MTASLNDLCRKVAEATSLEEGPSGVEGILRIVHGQQPVSPADVARELGFPIPVVSAIRRELEREGWLVRKGGMVLSDLGFQATAGIWGPTGEKETPATKEERSTCVPQSLEEVGTDEEELAEVDENEDLDPDLEDYLPLASVCSDGDEEDDPFLELIEEIYEERPAADPRFDQSHATLETVLRRAELFLHYGFVQGKRSLFLGDDDLTALVTFLTIRKSLGEYALRSCAGVVLEVDTRLVKFIREVTLSEDLPLAVVEGDLRNPLPDALKGRFDFFFTDPPYTDSGVALFLDRGCEALDPKGARRAALAVPLSPPSLQAATQRSLQKMGYVLDFLDPSFNEYEGATMQGGVSGLYGLTLLQTHLFEGSPHEGPLYTAERKNSHGEEQRGKVAAKHHRRNRKKNDPRK